MAAYIKKNTFLLALMVLFLLVVSSYARFNMMVTKEEIESICTKDDVNQSLCFEILKPTPEIAKLDFSGLAKFFINYQTQNTLDAQKQVKMFEGNTTYEDSKKVKYCGVLYENSLIHNDMALSSLATKDYDSVKLNLQYPPPCMDACSEGLSTMRPVPQVMITKNSDIKAMSKIILVILDCYILTPFLNTCH